jgi:hypothetical protein
VIVRGTVITFGGVMEKLIPGWPGILISG